MDEKVNTNMLKILVTEFGLPYVEDTTTISVVGLEKILIFYKLEEHECQLIEIY